MGQPVVHFEVIGKDGDKLRNYYSELFGWEIDANNPLNYGTVAREGNTNAGGIGIGGGVAAGPNPDNPGHVTFYVDTDDPQATLDKAEQLGGRTILPVTELPQVTIALFADPEGHVIGLAKGM